MSEIYETDALLSQYLLMHFGDAATVLPWAFGPTPALEFPRRCVEEGFSFDGKSVGRGLDIGCAVGGASFHLARYCGEVVGIDYSFKFIQAAQAMAEQGALKFRYPVSGQQEAEAEASAPHELRCTPRFLQGDAHALPEGLGRFDFVLCCNLLCRLRKPRQLLDQLPDLLPTGGQLLITTPETWLPEYTAPEDWLSGRPGDPPLLDTLQQALSPAFRLEHSWEMPFLIREHARKYQWSVAQASRWLRC